MPARAILLLTRPAVAGRVKSRLVEDGLSAEWAARLQAAFVHDLVHQLASVHAALIPCWALEGDEAVPTWPTGGVRQCAGDLGARLFHAFRAGAATDPSLRFAAAIGADCPDLPAAAIEAAFAALERGTDLALAPAEDGGYVLIAVRPDAVPRRLFERIPWGGPHVLETTLERAAELELSTTLLALARDVDRLDDLRALAARLADADPASCPATRALLAELDWPAERSRSCAS